MINVHLADWLGTQKRAEQGLNRVNMCVYTKCIRLYQHVCLIIFMEIQDSE